MLFAKIQEAINDAQQAKEYLNTVRKQFSDDPLLLQLYEPTAKEVYKAYLNQLMDILSQEFQINLTEEPEEEVDCWVRIQGPFFENGKAPVNIIGAYLKKIHTATNHATKLLYKKEGVTLNIPDPFAEPVLDINALKAGSLKIGLIWSILPKKEAINQQTIFFPNTDPFEIMKNVSLAKSFAIQGFGLLLKVIKSVEDFYLFDELTKEFDTKDIMRLIHFAKELTPSRRSFIESINFEPKNIAQPLTTVKATLKTRKVLSVREKDLKKDIIYVEGTGVIRAVDLDYLLLAVRPFNAGKIVLDSIDCQINFDLDDKILATYLDQPANISGFLVYGANNKLLRLEIEDINIIEEGETDEES